MLTGDNEATARAIDRVNAERMQQARLLASTDLTIASVTEPFCDTCNRLRLTAEGQLRNCLFALEETDLREPMRSGATDDELTTLIRRGIWTKWSGHRIDHPDFVQPARSMSMIGG